MLKLCVLCLFLGIIKGDYPNFSTVKVLGNYSQVMNFTLNMQSEILVVFNQSDSLNPYRMSTWVNTLRLDTPFKIVVNQEEHVTSWQVPYVKGTSRFDRQLIFRNVSQTLCHNRMEQIITNSSTSPLDKITQDFVLVLNTASIQNQNISILMQEQTDFYIAPNTNYQFNVSPTQVKHFYFRFLNNQTETVTVRISTAQNICLTVSIQNSTCPTFVMERGRNANIKYQTITSRGGLILSREEYPNGFYIVFIANADNYLCSKKFSSETTNLIAFANESSVSFIISEGLSKTSYKSTIIVTIVLFCILSICALAIQIYFNKYGTISKKTLQTNSEEPLVEESKLAMLKENRLTFDSLAMYSLKDQRRAYNYLWHILHITIFYGIPVVQLVFTYHRLVDQTGDQDVCYYNFLCAHPAWGLNDANHVFSNVGYVFAGVLFMKSVRIRQRILPQNEIGVPVQYGIFYSMGVGLVIEGVLSASYHICPNQSNFQFDTSFMYIMILLYMVKMYQNRHPFISTKSYKIFTVLGLIIFSAVIGILNAEFKLWIIFIVGYIVVCFYISCEIYLIYSKIDNIKTIKQGFSKEEIEKLQPMQKIRLYVLIATNLTNYLVLILGFALTSIEVMDFGTFLLALLMLNAIFYVIFYTSMKFVHGERICYEAIFYGLFAIVLWGLATSFFIDNATIWMLTPAESRQFNQECVLTGFYDKHDIWHLLSAPALYFTFMYLVYVDDDVIDRKRTQIVIF